MTLRDAVAVLACEDELHAPMQTRRGDGLTQSNDDVPESPRRGLVAIEAAISKADSDESTSW